jgi:hypothetical protein
MHAPRDATACTIALPPYDGLHRFVPTLLRIAGYRVVEVPVTHRARRFGESKFGVRNRAWRAFRDLLFVRWMQQRVLRYAIEPAAERCVPAPMTLPRRRPPWAAHTPGAPALPEVIRSFPVSLVTPVVRQPLPFR